MAIHRDAKHALQTFIQGGGELADLAGTEDLPGEELHIDDASYLGKLDSGISDGGGLRLRYNAESGRRDFYLEIPFYASGLPAGSDAGHDQANFRGALRGAVEQIGLDLADVRIEFVSVGGDAPEQSPWD